MMKSQLCALVVLTIVYLAECRRHHGHSMSLSQMGMMGPHGGRHMGGRVNMINVFKIPSNMEYKKAGQYDATFKSMTKGKARKYKNFRADWKTDIKEINMFKGQNITQVKTLHNEGHVRGNSGASKDLSRGSAQLIKKSSRKHMAPAKKDDMSLKF
ncbi:hypothetical protein HDE_02181 [Halotydeus destructor]|nr:hypothetical protein HDE_02181 [Halotydeus destructor]